MNHLTPMWFDKESIAVKPEGWNEGIYISFYPKTFYGDDKHFEAKELPNGERWAQGCSYGWIYWYFKVQEVA